MNIDRSKKIEILFYIITMLFSLIYLILKIGPIDLGIYPAYHGGDEGGGLYFTRMIMEYGYSAYNNNQVGYPFGVDLRNSPLTDIVTVTLIKILKLFTDDPATVMSLMFFLTFPFVSLCMYVVLRKLSINIYISFIVGQLYAFIPFHLLAVEHHSLCYYYMIPIAIFYAIKLATENNYISKMFSSTKNITLHTIILLFIVQTSAYFIIFVLLVIGVGIVAYLSQHGFSRNALKAFLIPLIMFIGIGLNWSPVIYAKFTVEHPSVLIVNARDISHSEIFAGRLSQLLLPATNHNSETLSSITDKYYKAIHYTFVNENTRQYLGIISGGIFIFSLFWLLGFKNNSMRQRQITFLSLLNIALFFWLTIGGFGILLALFVTPIVRAWNRLSIVINGASLIIFAIILQGIFIKYFQFSLKKTWVFYIVATGLLFFGLWDQSGRVHYYNSTTTEQYKNTKVFYQELASDLSDGSPIYQLPYLPMPLDIKNLGYSQLLAYTYAPNLRWNIGGMQGSPSAKLYSMLERAPIYVQVDKLKVLGFKALIFYKNYTDEQWWKDKYAELEEILGQPVKASADGSIVVFTIPFNDSNHYNDTLSLGEKIKNNFYTLDFSKPLLIEVHGFSGIEEWGRWADGDKSVLKFPINLPDRFKLEITGHGFGENSFLPTKIIIGNNTYEVIFNGESIVIDAADFGITDSIVFIPPKPTAPSEISDSTDTRKLTIGLIDLKIIEDNLK